MRHEPLSFVAGATGYTGRSVVACLASKNQKVVAHVRPDNRELAAWTRRFEEQGAQVDSTPWEPQALRARLLELAPSHVFALLGTTFSRARRETKTDPARKVDYASVDVRLTTMLIDAARALVPPPRVVFLSSIGTREGARNPYNASRWQIESHLRVQSPEWTIVRPSYITGPDRDERRLAETLGAAVSNALLQVIGALGATRTRDRYRSIPGPALAQALIHHAFAPGSKGRVIYAEECR